MKKDRWDLLKNGVPSGYREAVEFYDQNTQKYRHPSIIAEVYTLAKFQNNYRILNS